MRPLTWQTLTWATVCAAVASALLLASFDTGLPDLRAVVNAVGSAFPLPAEPTRAGPAAQGAPAAAPAASEPATAR